MRWRAALGLLLGWTLSACADDPAIEEGRRAVEALALQAEAVGLAKAFATSLDGVTGNNTAAEAAARQAQAAFTPAGCARVQIRGNELRVTLTDCNGPYGMAAMNGTLNATITVQSASQVDVLMTGDVRTRRSSFQPAVRASVTALLDSYSVQYSGSVTGTGSLGGAFTVSATGVGSLGAECVQLSGNASVGYGGQAWTVLIASYDRCAGGCPQTGGSLLLTRESGMQTRIQLNGGSEVTVTAATGREETSEVACGG